MVIMGLLLLAHLTMGGWQACLCHQPLTASLVPLPNHFQEQQTYIPILSPKSYSVVPSLARKGASKQRLELELRSIACDLKPDTSSPGEQSQ